MKVIKLGGSLLEQPEALSALFQSLKQSNDEIVLVHGGGALVQQWLATAGLHSEKVNGLRVSPEPHMPYIVGGLAGAANKTLMKQAIAAGLKPIGLTLYEAGVLCVKQSESLGQVGVCPASEGVSGLISDLLAQGYLPIISSIGFSDSGDWFNVNADDAAVAVAAAYNADLLLITDVEAVLDGSGTPLSHLNSESIQELTRAGVIKDGMEVKVRGALSAAKRLRRCVRIGSWNVMNNPFSGTQISE
ncbi:MAG TPA: acetylglutamate kinase [Idiomarina abyssalis]|uniref:acetylglutamate kinase n=1 Tax=Idiomarina TaxID=135575 RepID=UPI000C5ABF9B|nr:MULTISPECIES: acetylglutamate kinase [Idiomarina]MBH95061.1 acetylglutamate kinase [Idiomarina sp.]HAS14365.1 acetylglutamate kinase [Idiomarina abyssalis]|tara:strand:+ start:73337 stop:74074 length:738 start_codon:yes stop_codon:yes gene_type:complete